VSCASDERAHRKEAGSLGVDLAEDIDVGGQPGLRSGHDGASTALLGLLKRYGSDRVKAACAPGREVEAYNVRLIGRMLDRATEGRVEEVPIQGRLSSPRFARPSESFALGSQKRPQVDTDPEADRALEANTEDASTGDVADQAEGAPA
jgi:hypothetical protein